MSVKVQSTGKGAAVSHLSLWGEESAGDPVQVLRVDLEADVVEAHLVEGERARSGAEVTLASIRRDCDCPSQLTAGQVVADGTIHIILRGMKTHPVSALNAAAVSVTIKVCITDINRINLVHLTTFLHLVFFRVECLYGKKCY